MNDQWLTGIRHTAEQSQDFLKGQAQKLAHEIILYSQVESIIVLIVLFLCSKNLISLSASGKDDNDTGGVGMMISSALSIIDILLIIFTISWALKVFLAPRLYLIQQLMEMVK